MAKKNGNGSSGTIRVVIDLGNALVKYIAGGIRGCFVHAYREIDRSTYDEAVERHGADLPPDFITVKLDREIRYFVVGEAAEQYVTANRIGAPKYERSYYGPFLCRVLAEVFQTEPDPKMPIQVIASHAPIDLQFRDRITEAIKGTWDFTAGGYEHRITVGTVTKYDELVGGFLARNLKVTKTGVVATLEGMNVGVMDIGGGTESTILIPSSGKPSYATADSIALGINDAGRDLADFLKRDYPVQFQVRTIPERVIREAIRTNTVKVNGKPLDVSKQVARTLAPLISRAKELYRDRFSNGLGLDAVVVTGGGGYLLYPALQEALGHDNMMLALDDHENMHFANVVGAALYHEIRDREYV